MNKYQLQRIPLGLAIGSVLASGSIQAATITVDSSQDGALNTFPSACTLRAAIAAANTATSVDGCVSGSKGPDQIEFASSLQYSTITLTAGQLDITSSVTISGPVTGNSGGLVVSGNNTDRVLKITGTSPGSLEVALSSLSLVDGHVDYNTSGYDKYGAGIWAQHANLALTDAVISGHYAYYADGAGIRFEDGELTLDRVQVSNNRGNVIDGWYGGGIGVFRGDLIMTESRVTNNEAVYGGGGIFLAENSTATIEESEISGSTAGGGLLADGGAVHVVDSMITGNILTGVGSGGGIAGLGADIYILDSLVSGNEIIRTDSSGANDYGGGGIYVHNADLIILDSQIIGNYAGPYDMLGGGILVFNADLQMIGSVVSGNEIDGDGMVGGGLFVNGGTASILYSEISENGAYGNLASAGGVGIDSAKVSITNSTISGNVHNAVSPQAGATAGIRISGPSALTVVHSTIANNSPADTSGISAFQVQYGASLDLFNSLIVGDGGSAALCYGLNLTATNSLATDKTCSTTATDAGLIALEPLANNGGFTRTHALGQDSVAINAAGDCYGDLQISLDQRRVPRPGDGGEYCDLGAFELSDRIFADRFQ